jgi:2-iminobutanoate/2-iminopropanoate deaminase
LSDLGDLERYNAVYASHFAEPRPVRTTVGASLIGDMVIEITVVARRR